MDSSDQQQTLMQRRQFIQGIAAGGAFVGVSGLLAACGSGGSAPAAGTSSSPAVRRRGGNLKLGLTGGSGSDTLDPHKGRTYLDTARAQSLYQPLLQLTTAAQTEFVLAEEISPHGSTSEWIIRVRPGITFHDGSLLTAHDGVLRGRPGEHEPWIESFAAQGIIAGTKRAAQNHRNLGHHTVGDHVNQLGPGSNNAGLFGIAAHHEAVDVLEKDKRHPALIAVHDEAGGLVSGVNVNHTPKLQRAVGQLHTFALIGDNANGHTAQAAVAALEVVTAKSIYLIGDDRPVTRQEYYTQMATLLGAPEPRFETARLGSFEASRDATNKRVANVRMKRELGVSLYYPDITTGLTAALNPSRGRDD